MSDNEQLMSQFIKSSIDTHISLDIEEKIINNLQTHETRTLKKHIVLGFSLLLFTCFFCTTAFAVFHEIEDQLISGFIAVASLFFLLYSLNSICSLFRLFIYNNKNTLI